MASKIKRCPLDPKQCHGVSNGVRASCAICKYRLNSECCEKHEYVNAGTGSCRLCGQRVDSDIKIIMDTLSKAAMENNNEKVKQIVKLMNNVEGVKPDNSSPVELHDNKVNTHKTLKRIFTIKNFSNKMPGGIGINFNKYEFNDILIYALNNELTDIVESLCEYVSVDLNIKDADDLSPLNKAYELNNLHMVNVLLKAGANINATTGLQQKTLLCIACGDGNLYMVEALVAAGADINIGDKDNVSPLGYAATNGHSHIVIYLCSLPKINPNIVRTGKFVSESPLMYAAWKCSSEAVKALLDANADATAINTRNNHSTLIYALHNVGGKDEADKIISLLIDKGAKIDEIFLTQYTDKYGIKYTSKNNENQDGGRRNLKSKSRKSKTRKSRKSRKSRK